MCVTSNSPFLSYYYHCFYLYIFCSCFQLLSCVQLFATPSIAARQASLSFTISLSLLKLICIESVMPFNHLILCHPLLQNFFFTIIYFDIQLGPDLLDSLVAQTVKSLPAMQETWLRSLGWEDPLEKEIATHSSIIAWKIPWTEEPGGLQPTGSQRVRHDWVTSLWS